MTLSTAEILAEMFREITHKALLPIKNDQNVYIQLSLPQLTLIESYKGVLDEKNEAYTNRGI